MAKDNSKYSRREFLSRTSQGLCAAGIAGMSGNAVAGNRSRNVTIKEDKDIFYRTLGRTGLKVPIVSMGVMNANNPEVIKRSYEAGVRFFDTAMGYSGGRNETMIGNVISQMGIRDKVIIQTKVPPPGGRWGRSLSSDEVKAAFLKNFEGCLQRLKTDYVDSILVHDVTSAKTMNDPGIMEALSTLKQSKKARFIGVSTHSGQAVVLNEAARSEFYDVVLAAINFSMDDEEDLFNAIKNAASKNIGVIAMKTQGGGRGFRNFGTLNQTAALKWVLRNENITTAIPGYTNFDHMKEDFSVTYGLDYTSEEKDFLQDRDIRLGMEFCRQCYRCVDTCPQNVEIPTLMRTYMYAAQYSNFYQARTTLDSIPREFSLQACTSCMTCTARCVHSVNIAQNIDELQTMYV